MGYNLIDVGTIANDGTGDKLRNGGIEINRSVRTIVSGEATLADFLLNEYGSTEILTARIGTNIKLTNNDVYVCFQNTGTLVGDYALIAHDFNGILTDYADPSEFIAQRANGTASVPTKVLDTNEIGGLYIEGYDAAAFREVAKIIAKAAEDFGTEELGTELEFYTTPIGDTTPALAMTIGEDKSVTLEDLSGVGNRNIKADEDGKFIVDDNIYTEYTIGTNGADYQTLKDAIDAGKTRLLAIDNTIETGDIQLANNTSYYLRGADISLSIGFGQYKLLFAATVNFLSIENISIDYALTIAGTFIDTTNISRTKLQSLIVNDTGTTNGVRFINMPDATHTIIADDIIFNCGNHTECLPSDVIIDKNTFKLSNSKVIGNVGGATTAGTISGTYDNVNFSGTWSAFSMRNAIIKNCKISGVASVTIRDIQVNTLNASGIDFIFQADCYIIDIICDDISILQSDCTISNSQTGDVATTTTAPRFILNTSNIGGLNLVSLDNSILSNFITGDVTIHKNYGRSKLQGNKITGNIVEDSTGVGYDMQYIGNYITGNVTLGLLRDIFEGNMLATTKTITSAKDFCIINNNIVGSVNGAAGKITLNGDNCYCVNNIVESATVDNGASNDVSYKLF